MASADSVRYEAEMREYRQYEKEEKKRAKRVKRAKRKAKAEREKARAEAAAAVGGGAGTGGDGVGGPAGAGHNVSGRSSSSDAIPRGSASSGASSIAAAGGAYTQHPSLNPNFNFQQAMGAAAAGAGGQLHIPPIMMQQAFQQQQQVSQQQQQIQPADPYQVQPSPPPIPGLDTAQQQLNLFGPVLQLLQNQQRVQAQALPLHQQGQGQRQGQQVPHQANDMFVNALGGMLGQAQQQQPQQPSISQQFQPIPPSNASQLPLQLQVIAELQAILTGGQNTNAVNNNDAVGNPSLQQFANAPQVQQQQNQHQQAVHAQDPTLAQHVQESLPQQVQPQYQGQQGHQGAIGTQPLQQGNNEQFVQNFSMQQNAINTSNQPQHQGINANQPAGFLQPFSLPPAAIQVQAPMPHQATTLQGGQPSPGGENENSDEAVNDAAQGLTDLHSGSPE